ncbi:izumo sperm-egg fusion protein 1 isoform X1 [Archocentrus centrarchus]|uniref:izumo sperm-egg fusion protein 1 isoform X1 n=1 Tax=Archocentrus centrarchus TaxID=63155 RepID=UPI0011E9D56E|nr:izumo sperm-egg fusion protein 1 isoform X1 [Archocentrus centrarchus]XP_030592846.1 izumo sperm-egg fusion protein 1 isoform X1 [Archocentrus centrarchus]XP_030592847.1 izumo sperm-egg fusion protein 1 isoform X1 [Archocentrus centrarchus]
MLLMLVSLLCCVTAAKACLQCDRSIRMMHEDFILSASTVQDQIDLKKICDQAYVTYIETSQERKGVIDPTTLYRAKTEYQSEFDRFLKAKHTGSITFEAIQIMEKGRKILAKHLDAFIPNELCPNICGLLQRRVMDCLSCRYKVYVCPSPTDQQDCGEYPVLAEEGGQAVLNCFLPWHTLLLGTPEYHYSWVPGPSGTEKMDESDFKVLVVTDDSHVVLNQLRLDEEGTYRCSLQDQIGTIFYQAIFPLTVIPLPRQTPRPLVSLPSLSHGDSYSLFQPTEDLLVPLIAVVTALSLTASVGLTVVLRMMMTRQRAATELRSKKGNGTENTA